jgi:hypothetical protein
MFFIKAVARFKPNFNSHTISVRSKVTTSESYFLPIFSPYARKSRASARLKYLYFAAEIEAIFADFSASRHCLEVFSADAAEK